MSIMFPLKSGKRVRFAQCNNFHTRADCLLSITLIALNWKGNH